MKNWQDYATDAGSGHSKIPIKPTQKSPLSLKREQQAEQKQHREELLRWIRINTVILLVFVIPMVVGLVWGTAQFLRGGNPHNSVAQNIGEYIVGGALLGMFGPITLAIYLFSLVKKTTLNDVHAILYLGLFVGVPCVVILTFVNAIRALARRKLYRSDPKLRRLALVNFSLALALPLLAITLVVIMLILVATPWTNVILFLIASLLIIILIMIISIFVSRAPNSHT